MSETRARRWRRKARRLLDVQEIRRWLTLRCDHCGLRFRWGPKDARHSFGNRDGKVLHGPCIAYLTWRRHANERLEVVALMAELSGLTGSDVREAMGLRDSVGQPGSGSNGWNLAWRVFYDLEKSTTAASEPTP